MNHRVGIVLVITSLMFCALVSVAAATQKETDSEIKAQATKLYEKYIPNHLEVGTRATIYSFTDSTQGQPFDGSFLGSLNEVHENQNVAPVNAFVQYKFNPYFGIGTAYDQFKAATGSSPLGEEGGDGTFDLKGMYFYLLGSYPNESRFTPFAEVGLVRYSADFQEKDWWYAGGRRVINSTSTVGKVIAIGCDIHVLKQWSVDVYFRHVNVDLDVDYVFMRYRHTQGTFTLSHNEYGIGLKYSF